MSVRSVKIYIRGNTILFIIRKAHIRDYCDIIVWCVTVHLIPQSINWVTLKYNHINIISQCIQIWLYWLWQKVNWGQSLRLLRLDWNLLCAKSVKLILLQRKAFGLIFKVFIRRKNHILVPNVTNHFSSCWTWIDILMFITRKIFTNARYVKQLWEAQQVLMFIWEVIVEGRLIIAVCVEEIFLKTVIWAHMKRQT